MISVTTDSVPARERVEFWADLVSRHVTPIRIEPSGAHSVHGEIRAHAIGALGVAQVSGMGVLASHTRAHIARATDHVYAACVHVDGEARLTRRGETIALRPGDVFLTDSRQPFTFDLEPRWRHLVVTMPVHWLDGRVARPEALAGAVLRGHPLAHLWARHLAAGLAVADQLSATAKEIFARQSVELLGELLNESHRPGRTPSEVARAAIFASACRIIALEFGNPDLTPAIIARAVGVSSRTLARVFAAQGETVMRRVFDERARQHASSRRRRPRTARSARSRSAVASTTCRISGVSSPARCTQRHPSGGAGRCEARGQTNGPAHTRRPDRGGTSRSVPVMLRRSSRAESSTFASTGIVCLRPPRRSR